MSGRLTRPRLALLAVTATAFTAGSVDYASASNWGVGLAGASSGESQSGSLPPAPGGATASCVSANNDKIAVTWSPVSNATTYSIYQATSGATGPYSLAANGITTTSWTSGNLSTGSYWFEVAAVQGSNWQSANSSATAGSSTTHQGNAKTCTQP